MPTQRALHLTELFLCRLQVQNMLEHGKKGICLGDSDMFQHFPTGSCTSQNNCNPGSRPSAYDSICILLQDSVPTGHTHMGVAGMHTPEWRPCCMAGLQKETEQAQSTALGRVDSPECRPPSRAVVNAHFP